MIPVVAQALADAVLYEGYMLYPYRATSLKNSQRWTFGGLNPCDCCDAQRMESGWIQQAEFLVKGRAATVIQATVRFLHLCAQTLPVSSGSGMPTATERTIVCNEISLAETVGAPYRKLFEFPSSVELSIDCGDAAAASVAFPPISGFCEIAVEILSPALFRVRLRTANLSRTEGCQTARFGVYPQTMAAVHAICSVAHGEFLSLTDPRDSDFDASQGCRNVGTWPVLVGEPGTGDVLLCSPIILSDYQQIATASPGDLYDGTEIDEILTLRVRALTDAEKRELRASDERIHRLLERSELLSAEQILNLHAQMQPAVKSVGTGS